MAARALSGEMVARLQRRIVDQRSEERYEDVVVRAALHFRGREHIVPVVNISTRGTMVESDLVPRLGESVIVRFEGCTPIYAFVRWVRGGRIGLNFGSELELS